MIFGLEEYQHAREEGHSDDVVHLCGVGLVRRRERKLWMVGAVTWITWMMDGGGVYARCSLKAYTPTLLRYHAITLPRYATMLLRYYAHHNQVSNKDTKVAEAGYG